MATSTTELTLLYRYLFNFVFVWLAHFARFARCSMKSGEFFVVNDGEVDQEKLKQKQKQKQKRRKINSPVPPEEIIIL